jgi:hypothetical protein
MVPLSEQTLQARLTYTLRGVTNGFAWNLPGRTLCSAVFFVRPSEPMLIAVSNANAVTGLSPRHDQLAGRGRPNANQSQSRRAIPSPDQGRVVFVAVSHPRPDRN